MYTYYKTDNKIICVSTYAGRSLRGIAKCSPHDTFDEQKGRELAKLRCDKKVALRRYQNAQKRYNEAIAALSKAHQYMAKMRDYACDAADEVSSITDQLSAMESKL